MIKRNKKSSLFILLILLIGVQLVPIEKNEGDPDGTHSLFKSGIMPENIHQILKSSCYDCHSDATNYPWYSRIQPIGLWISNHVKDGKRHLNFSQMMTYTSKRKNHKLEEIIETIDENEMPLKSYTLIHHHAVLSDKQKSDVISWVKSVLKK
jgi:hypothetical protein